jgi:RNA recognition motif-containing protein
MAESAEADKAITALNGTKLGGRALTVNEARPKVARVGYGSEGGYRSDRGRRW